MRITPKVSRLTDVSVSNKKEGWYCPLCKSSHRRLFTNFLEKDRVINYWRCLSCGLIFQFPQMNETELKVFYSTQYRIDLFNQSEPPQFDIGIQKARAIHLSNFVKGQCGNLRGHEHLDIGCGDGALISRFQKDFACIGYGIEPDNAYRKYVGSQGITVFPSLSDWCLNHTQKVGLVSLSHVLEHLIDPVEYLANIRENVLESNGFLLIEVPNLYFHQSFELAHNYAFSLHTLKLVVQKAGFELIVIKKHGIPLKHTPRYLTILALPLPGIETKPIKPEFPFIYTRRLVGRSISKIEDSGDRIRRRIRRLFFTNEE